MDPKGQVCTVSKTKYEIFRDDEWETWTGNASKSHIISGPISGSASAIGAQELLISKGHPWWKLGKESGDIGGPFCVIRREYEEGYNPRVHNRTVTDDTNIFAENYVGNYYAFEDSVGSSDFPLPILASDFELDAMGTTAIARSIPTNPVNGLVVTLGELKREGIPALVGATSWKDRTSKARAAGGEYLNYQFGWAPLVSEIRSMARTVLSFDEISKRYESESGKLLHRQYTFPAVTSNSETEVSGVYPKPAYTVGYWNSTGVRTRLESIKTEVWFEGTFTYYLPPVGSLEREVAIARKLWGLELTPEVVWNLTPWTWAVDWFVNAGDVVHNVSRFSQDGLIMPYAYIMSRRTHKVLYRLRGARMKRDNTEIDTFQSFTTTVKQRMKATPFGFGLNPSTFSSRQWTILGALGLTKGTRGMKYE